MKGDLLDVNLLIALAWPNHPQHAKADAWFGNHSKDGWGTCMVTQLGFVRVSSHPVVESFVSTQEALRKLKEIVETPGHEFWSEPPGGYLNREFAKTMPNTLTHGAVTDGYLATVASFNGGKLATLDRQLTKLFGAMTVLVGE
jgi:toxin-antitoxin system PIN domain toxin